MASKKTVRSGYLLILLRIRYVGIGFEEMLMFDGQNDRGVITKPGRYPELPTHKPVSSWLER
jgi:hypothetical protein